MVLGPRWLIPFSWCQEPGQGFSGCKNSEELFLPNCLAFLAQKALHTSVGQLLSASRPYPVQVVAVGTARSRAGLQSPTTKALTTQEPWTWLLQKSQPLRELTDKYVCAYTYF